MIMNMTVTAGTCRGFTVGHAPMYINLLRPPHAHGAGALLAVLPVKETGLQKHSQAQVAEVCRAGFEPRQPDSQIKDLSGVARKKK